MERASLSFHFTAQLLCLSSYGSAFVVFIYGLAVVLSSYGSAVAACGGLPPCAYVFYTTRAPMSFTTNVMDAFFFHLGLSLG